MVNVNTENLLKLTYDILKSLDHHLMVVSQFLQLNLHLIIRLLFQKNFGVLLRSVQPSKQISSVFFCPRLSSSLNKLLLIYRIIVFKVSFLP